MTAFLSIEDATIGFQNGVHLINGVNYDMECDGNESNGAGKSSLMDALLWCIFGELSRGKCKENEVINRSIGKNCLVEVAFEHEGKSWRIRRTRKHDEHGNSLSFWIDNEEMTLKGARDTGKLLAETLPVSATLFKHAIQVGQGMPDKFLDLSEREKQELLCEVVDMAVYEKALDHAKGEIAVRNQSIVMTDGSIKGIQDQVERWALELENYKVSLRTYESRSAEDMEALKKKVALLEIEINSDNSRADALSSQKVYPLKEKVEVTRAEVQRLRDRKAAMEQDLRPYAEKVRAADRVVSEIKARGKAMKAQQEEMSNAPKNCPTCGQKLEGEDIMPHLMELARKQDALFNDEYKPAKVVLDAANAEYDGQVAAVTAFDTQLNAKVEEERADVRAFEAAQEEIQAIFRSIPAKQREKDNTEGTLRTYETQASQMRDKVKYTESQLEELTKSITPHVERKKQLEREKDHWTFWKDSVPNLRASAMEEVLSFINERLDYYMDTFSAGAMGVRLYQEAFGKGSKIKVEMRTPAGTYGMSSGGEKRRVDLALYLSLSDLLHASAGLKSNILVADEICDGLSPTGVQKFLDVLRLKAQDGLAVFVITHNVAVAQNFEFDSTYLVERRNGVASILHAAG
jgi:DNA repair exonuclease SbcCD ATPase subunit